MKSFLSSLLVLAAAVCAGCADRPPATAQMGAGAAPVKLYCRDGAWVSGSGSCAMHGGVERDMTPAAATQTRY